jgi:hypothetical protein
METNDYNRRYYSTETFEQARWIPALILIGIGAAFLLNNLRVIPFYQLWQYWPVALVVVGLFRLVDSVHMNEKLMGGALIVVGGVLLCGTLGLFQVTWNTIWPLFLIGAGVLLLLQRLSPNFDVSAAPNSSCGTTAPGTAGPSSAAWLHEAAIFSGGKRRIKGDFKGGKLDCMFGGFDINLRQATMSADFAELEINAVFGGAEIKVPESWEVVLRGAGVFGAFSDETAHPSPGEFPNPKRLILKGAAVFGGVSIKN